MWYRIDQNLIGTAANGEKIIIPDRSVVKIFADRGEKLL